MDSRIASEIEFHNRAYTEDLRVDTSKYYLSIQASIDYYRRRLEKRSPGKDVLEYGCGENSYATLLSRWAAGLPPSISRTSQSTTAARPRRRRSSRTSVSK